MPSLSAKRSFAQSNMSKHVKTAILGAECERKLCSAEPVCRHLPENPLLSIFHCTVRHVTAWWQKSWCDIKWCLHLASITKMGAAYGSNLRFFRKTLHTLLCCISSWHTDQCHLALDQEPVPGCKLNPRCTLSGQFARKYATKAFGKFCEWPGTPRASFAERTTRKWTYCLGQVTCAKMSRSFSPAYPAKMAMSSCNLTSSNMGHSGLHSATCTVRNGSDMLGHDHIERCADF